MVKITARDLKGTSKILQKPVVAWEWLDRRSESWGGGGGALKSLKLGGQREKGVPEKIETVRGEKKGHPSSRSARSPWRKKNFKAWEGGKVNEKKGETEGLRRRRPNRRFGLTRGLNEL